MDGGGELTFVFSAQLRHRVSTEYLFTNIHRFRPVTRLKSEHRETGRERETGQTTRRDRRHVECTRPANWQVSGVYPRPSMNFI